jgi:uncharacterized membrane protein
MNNKKIGVIILVLSVLSAAWIYSFVGDVENQALQKSCYTTVECSTIGATLNYSHIGIGIIFSLVSLGIYLVFFYNSEQALYKKIENEMKNMQKEDKLKIIEMLLSDNERKVFQAIREREGISQYLLRIKTDLSKATISQILATFEKRGLIKREPNGKTYDVYLIREI